MIDTCLITRAGDEPPVLNEDSGEYETDSETVYDGPCQVTTNSTVATEREAGDRFTFGSRVVVKLPAATTGPSKGDLVTVTEATFTPALQGRAYRVRSVVAKTYATAIRLECEEA